MAATLDADTPRTLTFARRLGWSALSGFVAFAGSALLDDALKVSIADQLVLTVLAGGVTLLVQYLAEFERRLSQSAAYQRAILTELHSAIAEGFAGVSDATALVEHLERSAIPKEPLRQAIWRTGLITTSTKPLVRAIACSELERVSDVLQSLADGHEVFYEGEDRELLLALTRRATKSILATSWATVSTHGLGFEAGFWMNDLGGRYLDLQRTAIRRGVTIKRLFIYETPDLINSDVHKRIIAMHFNAGIEVKVLGAGPIPPDGSISDFVLFDDEVSYDTTPVTRGEASSAPWLLTTRLVLSDEVVHDRIVRFQGLWDAATHPGRPPSYPSGT
ncbi:hypothetical protein [Cryptosporangium minutisporangium]|uniref:PLD phosphodiesterase domain-containing protein n=1 Tax=Cryptosporangium minutisporangium TaxID=113569 RepID=A0ABP6TCY8_9ACTN